MNKEINIDQIFLISIQWLSPSRNYNDQSKRERWSDSCKTGQKIALFSKL